VPKQEGPKTAKTGHKLTFLPYWSEKRMAYWVFAFGRVNWNLSEQRIAFYPNKAELDPVA
jgi:hypothetical protein